jgi:hypothetical protein
VAVALPLIAPIRRGQLPKARQLIVDWFAQRLGTLPRPSA